MNNLLIVIFFICTLALLSQFGGRLSAKKSVLWLGVFALTAWIVVFPDSLQSVAEILGFQLASNFIFAAFISFCLFYLFVETGTSTRIIRYQRTMVTEQAKRDYFLKNNFSSNAAPETLVVVPCYNEQDSISDILLQLNREIHQNNLNCKVCVVDDASSDKSSEILLEQANQSYVSHVVNSGVSGALLTGFKIAKEAQCDYVVQMDADGQHPVSELKKLIEIAKQHKTDLLIGSRFVQQQEKDSSTTFLRRVGSVVISATIRVLFGGKKVKDPTSGFRVYSKKAYTELIKNMPDEYPEPETIALLALSNSKILESPVVMKARHSGTSSISGIKPVLFMTKVISALLGLRLRTLFK